MASSISANNLDPMTSMHGNLLNIMFVIHLVGEKYSDLTISYKNMYHIFQILSTGICLSISTAPLELVSSKGPGSWMLTTETGAWLSSGLGLNARLCVRMPQSVQGLTSPAITTLVCWWNPLSRNHKSPIIKLQRYEIIWLVTTSVGYWNTMYNTIDG